MKGDVVGLEFTVRIGQHSGKVGNEQGTATRKRTEEHAPMVIVIGVDVVPDEGRPTEHPK